MTKRTDLDTEKKIIQMYTTPATDGTWVGAKTISIIFGITDTTVQNILKRNGVSTRNYREAHSAGKRCKPITNLPPQGESAPLCKCGCGAPVIWNQRKNRWNVYVEGHYRKDAPYKDANWLRQEYEVKRRTIQDIAGQFGVGNKVVDRFMRRFGIVKRTTSEALILNGSVSGSRNPAWKGGVAKWAYAPNWKRIAHDIRKRDNYTCQICKTQFPKSSKILHVHHMDGNKLNNEPSNLMTVCATCHPKGKRKENGSI